MWKIKDYKSDTGSNRLAGLLAVTGFSLCSQVSTLLVKNKEMLTEKLRTDKMVHCHLEVALGIGMC